MDVISPVHRLNRTADIIRNYAAQRILLMDGATGTMIQSYGLAEAEYRGTSFADHGHDQKGNNDLLCLTKPQIVREIHDRFLEVGADIIETNSFNGTRISQADYGMQDQVREINMAAARIARKAADSWSAKTPDKPRFVAGAIGPTNKTLSVSPRVNEPDYRDVSFDEMKDVYKEQAAALIEGGADLLVVETIFDTLNAKAALCGIDELSEKFGIKIPVILAVTITDLSGRNLSGQTVDAFWHSVRHADPLAVGMNCSFGAEQLRPHMLNLARDADTLICVYPNAGLPNELGDYDEAPADTAAALEAFVDDGLVNIVGGCCGTTPDHIAAIARMINGKAPRPIPRHSPRLRLAGLEAMTV